MRIPDLYNVAPIQDELGYRILLPSDQISRRLMNKLMGDDKIVRLVHDV
jgi:hypothetical protein